MLDNDINHNDQGVRDGTNIIEPEPTVEELVTLVQAMQRDWIMLNDHLNRTAASYSWCSEYEERLEHYNSTFTVMKMAGRPDYRRGNVRDPYQPRYMMVNTEVQSRPCTCTSCAEEVRQEEALRRREPETRLVYGGEAAPPIRLQEALERLQRILQQRDAL